MEDRDNRDRRRRQRLREARELIERTAKLRKPDEACPVCGGLFDCESGCLVRDAREWNAKNRVRS